MLPNIRIRVAPVFLLCLGWSYQRSVPAVVPVVTEERQAVVFGKRNWQMRELAKQLPLEGKNLLISGDAVPYASHGHWRRGFHYTAAAD